MKTKVTKAIDAELEVYEEQGLGAKDYRAALARIARLAVTEAIAAYELEIFSAVNRPLARPTSDIVAAVMGDDNG